MPIGTPPGHMNSGQPIQDHMTGQMHPTPPPMSQGPPLPPPPQQQPPPPHLQHHQPQQQQHHPHTPHSNAMHNHGHMMPAGQHQNHYMAQGQPPQQQQMIATSKSPHMIGPTPSHSPYSMQHGGLMNCPPPPHQALTPQPLPQAQQAPTQAPPTSMPMFQQQQQQPQPPHQHHLESSNTQQPYSVNQNIYCGKCQREVYHNEPSIVCKAGCRAYFHISCSGLTQLACDLLMKESLAEWACDRCTSGNRRVPYVKFKS